MKHENAPLGQIHVPYNWIFNNATARLAVTSFLQTDLGKLAYQLSDNTLWILIGTQGIWKDIVGTVSIVSGHWRDLNSEIDPRSGNTAPAWTVFRNGIYFYAFSPSAMREVFSNFHFQHDYLLGSAVFAHVHFSINTQASGVVRWGIEYTIARGHQQTTGSTFPTTTTIYAEQTIVGTTDQYKHFVLDFPGVTDSNIEPDTIMSCRLFRDATSVNDTYPDIVFGIKFDLHYQVDGYATVNRLPNFYTI